MDRTLGDLLTGLERAAAGAEASTIVRLLGDLERLKALLWQRLAATVVRADAMDPPADDVEALRHLTPHQVAELLSIKPAYVHELCRTRRLPAMKSGKYWMISVAGLRRWLMSGNGDVDATVTERLQSPPPHADAGRPHPGAATAAER
jgi:excisionase family DNA binding protein